MSKNKITSDDGVSRKINLCSEKPTNDFTVYGDWIYLNGSSTVLIEYKVCTIKMVDKLINYNKIFDPFEKLCFLI